MSLLLGPLVARGRADTVAGENIWAGTKAKINQDRARIHGKVRDTARARNGAEVRVLAGKR